MSAWGWAGWALAAALVALWLAQRLQLRRLLRWTALDAADAAPRLTGPLAELAYRFEKALRQREAQSRRQRDRLQQFLWALEAYPNGILLLDADERIQWLNPVAAEHLELHRERDREQNVRNLVRAPAFISLLQEPSAGSTLISQGAHQLQVTLRRFGDERHGPGGRSALLLTQDITERLRLERMRRDFVSNVSHEIRSPLTVLIGFLETLVDLDLDTAERQRCIHLMRQQADRMQLLVTDLLALAQLEGAPHPPPDSWFDLPALLQRCLADARAADQNRHPLSIDPLDAHISLSGAESEWQSAFANLVSNALRYTPDGGAVHMAWRWLEDGRGEFAVLDSGIGIAPEHLPRLTERFYRVDSSRSRQTGGTGLGLAIVKHVLQRHGAELLIESQLGKGSQFRIRIPAHRLQRRTPDGKTDTAGASVA